MKDQWLKDIHDRMSDFETKEPDGLWTAIESGMAAPGNRRQPVNLWIKRAAGIAAMIAIAVSVYMWFPDSNNMLPEFPVAGQPVAAVESSKPDGEVPKEAATKNIITHVGSISPTANRTIIAICNDTIAQPAVTVDTHEKPRTDKIAHETSSQKENGDSVARPTERNDLETARKRPVNQYYQARASRQKSAGGHARLSVGVFTSGGIDMTKQNASPTYAADHVTGSDGMAWKDSPLLGLLLFNKGNEVVTEMKHRLPIKTGATIAYRLNDRIAIESGLVYANLTSDMKYGGAKNYMSGHQKLHYIGIPLNVKYRALSWKHLDVYGSAGVMTEKCVSGKIEKDYFFDSSNRRKESENAMVKPLQWSVNVSAGVQYNIAGIVGIYAEPGMSRYIDNGSTVRTIYKDKPLNFSMNLGLRLTIGAER